MPSGPWRAVALGVGLALSGCAAGPDYAPPPVDAPASFGGTHTAVSTDPVVAAWWEQFDDPILSELVGTALVRNHDLRIALASVNEARAIHTETVLTLLPIVNTVGSYQRVRLSDIRTADDGVPQQDQAFVDLGFDATWEVDFFGRLRRAVEASDAAIEREEATLRDAIVIVTGEVGRAYFELRGRQEELAVAMRNARNQEDTLELTEALLEEGRGTELDTSRARSQLEATRALIPPIETLLRAAIHRLSVLTGSPPDALLPTLEAPLRIPPAPAVLALEDPAALLRRRPDIRAAERNLAVATAEIGVFTADLFPRVVFVGSVSAEAADLGGLFLPGTGNFSFGPGIRWAAFDLGRVQARIRQADARAEGALAFYEQTVLRALEETENALVAYGNLQRETQSLRASAEASALASELARLRYEDGVSDFLAVLDAERRLLESQDSLARAETRAGIALVAVYKALGGAWQVLQ